MTISQDIKDRLDIVEVISPYVNLRKAGRRYSGFCPFHHNTRTPAFYVFPETQTWYCFGACAEGGDIFAFLMKKEGWDFREALENLASRAGVTLESDSPQQKKQRAYEDRLGDLLESAADYFHQLLLYAPEAAEARRYVAGRHLNEQTLATFKIGFALKSWDACRNHFQAQGYSQQDLLDAGLITENEERATVYDRFRNRLMIPIRNVQGQVVGFGARTLEKDGIPKYLNSPQTPLFDKSRLLFGLDMAKRHIREARQAVIVEGYMDVLQAWQTGFRNVVAQMGTALTETQLQTLKRFSKRFIIALDPDEAGVNATMRSLQVARDTLDRDVEVRFDARGLVRHEGRLKADIRVLALPDGMDPDDFIRTRPAEWPVLVEQAQPITAYVIDVLTRQVDLRDPKAKAEAARQIVPVIRDVADPVERDHYWQLLARTLQTDERALRRIVPEGRAAATPPPEPPVKAVDKVDTDLRQANFLRLCLRFPTLVHQVDGRLQANRQPPVTDREFHTPDDRALWRFLREQIGAPTQVVTAEELWDSLQHALLERAQTLTNLPLDGVSDHDRLPDKLALSVLEWRVTDIRQMRDDLKHMIDEARRDDQADVVEMCTFKLQSTVQIELGINRAKLALSAAGKGRA